MEQEGIEEPRVMAVDVVLVASGSRESRSTEGSGSAILVVTGSTGNSWEAILTGSENTGYSGTHTWAEATSATSGGVELAMVPWCIRTRDPYAGSIIFISRSVRICGNRAGKRIQMQFKHFFEVF